VNLEWRNLSPDRPLALEDSRYVERPDDGGARIAEWILRADKDRIFLAGPTGIGKSTELARAASELQPHRVVCLVPLDRLEDIRLVTPESLLLRMAGRLAWLAIEHLQLELSPGIRHVLAARGMLDAKHDTGGGEMVADAQTIATAAIREVARSSRQGRVVFLVDGLEKLPREAGPGVFAALASLPEGSEVAAAVPWHAACGPQAFDTLQSGWKLVILRPLLVDGAIAPGVRFLATIAARRLGLADDAFHISASALKNRLVPVPVRRVVSRAAAMSGGIPRTFLQLLADAVSYVRFRAGITPDPIWPDKDALDDAIRDHEDSLRRLLLPGDLAEMHAVDGTGGEEMDADRRIRLLTHGILIESSERGRAVLRPHPLVRCLLGPGAANA
jgi:hypothetical protein